MANAYSILHNYDQPVYQPNLDLVTKVLSYKQQKLDTGRQKLQSLYDEFSMLDIYKDSDREYAEERLNQVKSMVDRYASGDLSSDALVRDIASNMDNFVDDNVINAVVSTKGFKSDLSKWSQVQEDDPDRFGEQNYRYAMNRAQNYLANDKVGQKYNGEASFIEYVDVNKLMHENAQKLSKTLKASFVRDVDGKYFFKEQETGKRVDRRKLSAALNTIMGPKEQRQMSINAWDTYDNLPEEALQEQYTRYYGAKVAEQGQEKSKWENYLKTENLTKEERAEVSSVINALDRDITQLKADSDFQQDLQTYGKEAVMTNLYSRQFMDGILDAYEFEEVTSRKVNDAHYKSETIKLKRLDYERRLAKDLKDSIETTRDMDTPIMGENVLVEGFDKDAPSALAYKQQKQASTYKTLKDNLKGTNSLTDDQTSDVIDMLASSEGLVLSKNEIEVNGKKIKITPEIRRAALEYKTVANGFSEADILIDEVFNSVVAQTQESLKEAFREDNWNALENDYRQYIPKPTGYYEEKSDGGYRFVESNPESAIEVVRATFNKPEGQLTGAERLNRDLYTQTAITFDPKLTEEQREESKNRLIKRSHQDNVKPIPLSMRRSGISQIGAPGASHTVYLGEDGRIRTSETFVNPYSLFESGGEAVSTGGLNVQGLSSIGSYQWEVDKGQGDLDLTSDNPKEILSGLGRNIEAATKTIVEQRMLPGPRKATYNYDTETASKIFSIVSSKEGVDSQSINKKQDPTLVPSYDAESGTVDGYAVEYYQQGGVGKIVTKKIPIDVFERAGITSGDTSEPLINAEIPDQIVELGTYNSYLSEGGVISSGSNELKAAMDMKIQAHQVFGGAISKSPKEVRRELGDLFDDFIDGNINFKLRSTGQNIAVDVYRGTQVVHSASGILKDKALRAQDFENPMDILKIQIQALLQTGNRIASKPQNFEAQVRQLNEQLRFQ